MQVQRETVTSAQVSVADALLVTVTQTPNDAGLTEDKASSNSFGYLPWIPGIACSWLLGSFYILLGAT